MSEVMRTALSPKLAAYFEASLTPPPLVLVELLARLCVVEAMAEFERTRPGQISFGLAIGDL
jgi:hypothetical protein